MKVLFICRGNVGRSQVAEAIFTKLAKNQHSATSAGTRVRDKEGNSREGTKLKDIGGAEKVLIALKEIGIDASENVSNQLNPELLDNADIAIVMAEKETIPDYLSKSNKCAYWDIVDMKDQSLEDVRIGRDKIYALSEKLVKTLG
jgi:arsenate reductase